MTDMHHAVRRSAEFRFYQELNDFLPASQRQLAFCHSFVDCPSIKDTIQALGVPHTEIDLILVDGISVDFNYRMQGGERVAVYPVFEALDIGPLIHLRPKPLRNSRFICDTHLGKLARYLRLLGFDTRYDNHATDRQIIALSIDEQRIILTRDLGILKQNAVTHGYWVRNIQPRRQLAEIITALQLETSLRPFSRCAACNSVLYPVEKATIQSLLPRQTRETFRQFQQCPGCNKIYWQGSHYQRISQLIVQLTGAQPVT